MRGSSKINKNQVKEINKLILVNGYDCIVAKRWNTHKEYNEELWLQRTQKSRDVKVTESNEYIMFNLE